MKTTKMTKHDENTNNVKSCENVKTYKTCQQITDNDDTLETMTNHVETI